MVVGLGLNGVNLYYEVSDWTIQEGDMVVMDFGGFKDGYGLDMMCIVYVGELIDEECEVFEIVWCV